MPLLMLMELPGATTEQYDRVNEILGVGTDEAPPGLISHHAGRAGDGLLIVDVWESEDALGRFLDSGLRDAAGKAGLPEVPPRVLPVHNIIEHGAGTEPAVLMIAEIEGSGPDVYDRMVAGMDAHVSDGSRHPSVSHVAAKTERGGILVVDVWDSPESFGRFAEEQIGPEASKAGLGPIEPRFVPIHSRIVRARAAV